VRRAGRIRARRASRASAVGAAHGHTDLSIAVRSRALAANSCGCHWPRSLLLPNRLLVSLIVVSETALSVLGLDASQVGSESEHSQELPRSTPPESQSEAHWALLRGKKQLSIDTAVSVVGRGDDVHLQLDDPSVSRRHALLRACGELIVEDLGSRNGTFVNGRRIDQPVALQLGDDLAFGAYELRVAVFSETLRSEGYATQPIVKHLEVSALGNLSPRERELLPLLARGLSQRELAARLGVTVKTIETYRTRIGHKLGLTSRAGLVRFALDNGLLQPTSPTS
jgi:DNA-binding CsgD family transcriptional regulator